jgi:hypothetical protein
MQNARGLQSLQFAELTVVVVFWLCLETELHRLPLAARWSFRFLNTIETWKTLRTELVE